MKKIALSLIFTTLIALVVHPGVAIINANTKLDFVFSDMTTALEEIGVEIISEFDNRIVYQIVEDEGLFEYQEDIILLSNGLEEIITKKFLLTDTGRKIPVEEVTNQIEETDEEITIFDPVTKEKTVINYDLYLEMKFHEDFSDGINPVDPKPIDPPIGIDPPIKYYSLDPSQEFYITENEFGIMSVPYVDRSGGSWITNIRWQELSDGTAIANIGCYACAKRVKIKDNVSYNNFKWASNDVRKAENATALALIPGGTLLAAVNAALKGNIFSLSAMKKLLTGILKTIPTIGVTIAIINYALTVRTATNYYYKVK